MTSLRCGAGLRTMLESRGDWEIIGEAGDGEQGLAQAKRHRPDIAVIDIGMLKTNGLTLTRETRRLLPAVEVLIVTDHDSRQMLQQRRKPARGGML